MKTMKKMVLVLTALLAVFAFAGCSDDDDEDDGSVVLNFSLADASKFTIENETITAGLFVSDVATIEGESGRFFLYANTTDKSWMFGMMNDDTSTSSIIPLVGLYKGTFTEVSSRDTLNRTHIVDSEFNWTPSVKLAWKVITVSASGTFSLTVTADDIAELNAIFPD